MNTLYIILITLYYIIFEFIEEKVQKKMKP